MADNVLLSASRSNIHEAMALAQERGLGIEIMAFAFPDILDGDWRTTLAEYKAILKPLNGTLTLHGPFMDMVSGSPDPRINAVCALMPAFASPFALTRLSGCSTTVRAAPVGAGWLMPMSASNFQVPSACLRQTVMNSPCPAASLSVAFPLNSHGPVV